MMITHPTNRRTFLGAALLAALSLRARAATTARQSRPHVVLLGDSVFDNGAYVSGGPDVARQLRQSLAPAGRVTLAAQDGALTSTVQMQMQRVPADASHIALSVGGNDALHYSSVLDEKARSVSEALEKLAKVRERFEASYHTMLNGVMRLGIPIAVCTIYDGRFPDPKQRRLASVGLTIFNDCITREASARGISLIDLRVICKEDRDFANAIEPSVFGGAKIANAIAKFTREYDSSRGRSEVFV